MASNRGVAYVGPGKVEVKSIDYPKLKMPASETNPFGGKDAPHGVILKVVTTNICGSDQHMVRGRTTAPKGLILGHEITGEVIEKGVDVEMLNVGDLCSVPFNIACGRCRNCREGQTGICLTVNPARPGAAYGYVDMGGWVGGQAEYVLVPYADFNLMKFPNKDKAMAKIKDLTLLSDIFPTGFHGAVKAGVGPGSVVYVAGAGPVGLEAAAHRSMTRGPGDAELLRAIAGKLVAAGRDAILCATDDGGTTVVIFRATGSTLDCGALWKQLAARSGGRGGGRADRAEGRLAVAIADWPAAVAQVFQ